MSFYLFTFHGLEGSCAYMKCQFFQINAFFLQCFQYTGSEVQSGCRPSRPVRVATKFVNIAKSYYASMGRDIDIIKLNGSIELAPILGLSDVIVDIVETGTTLRENGLKVVTEFMPISARFIANKASYQFKHAEMDTMLEKLRAELQNKEEAK